MNRPAHTAYIETTPGRVTSFTYVEYLDLLDHILRLRKLGSRALVIRVVPMRGI